VSQLAIDSPGSLQERWNVPVDLLIAVPDEIGLRDAALITDVLLLAEAPAAIERLSGGGDVVKLPITTA